MESRVTSTRGVGLIVAPTPLTDRRYRWPASCFGRGAKGILAPLRTRRTAPRPLGETMRQLHTIVLVVACLVSLTGCWGDSDQGADEGPAGAATADQQAASSPVAGDASATQADSELVANVNGEGIPLAEFQRQVFEAQHYYVDQGLDPNSDEGQLQLGSVRRQVLDDMIDQALIEQAAAEQGVTVSDQELSERMALYVEQFGGEEELEESLAKRGTTREDIEAMERSAVIGLKMRDIIGGDVASERMAAVHVRHILCDVAQECEEARQRILDGEDFAAVAKGSADETSRDLGGDLDWIARGTHWSQAFEEAIFGLEVGQVSSVVSTEYGFHVIEVLERDEARELSEIQINNLKEKRLMDWLAERRATSTIEIYVADLAVEPQANG